MNIYNYTELRQNLKQVLDKVVDDCDGIVIKRRDAEDAVIMSKSHYDSLMETFYLLKSPANAKHLLDAIAEDKAGKIEYHDLIEEEE